MFKSTEYKMSKLEVFIYVMCVVVIVVPLCIIAMLIASASDTQVATPDTATVDFIAHNVEE